MMKIQLTDVGKRFRYRWIFQSVNLSLESGKEYAVTGPNGSGKSTLLKLISGSMLPSAGIISFVDKGTSVSSTEVYRSIAFAAPYIDLIEEFTLVEAIKFHLSFKPFQNNLTSQQLIAELNLPSSRHQSIKNFSSGMKQRLKLALNICSATKVLLLDEPTSNLDRQGIQWYLQLLAKYAKGRLVIIASNTEIDYQFCDEVIDIQNYKPASKA